MAGRSYLSPGIAGKVVSGYVDRKGTSVPQSSWDTITPRERQVLKLIGEGRSNKELAYYLGISVKTAEKHRANIMNKLNLHNVSALISYAVRKGLVDPF